MRRGAVVLAIAAACGRVNFDALGNDDGGVDGSTARANVAFVTRDVFSSNLGGIAGADASCQTAAERAGLQGTFRAFISTTTVNAIDRFGNSRGWLGTDGVPILDSITDIASNGNMLNPISHDEYGQLANASVRGVWTGTDTSGLYDPIGESCGDWTIDQTVAGTRIGFWSRSPPDSISAQPGACGSFGHRLYCLETGFAVPVIPVGIAGRRAFIAASASDVGLLGLDMACQTAALDAGLTGTFLAAVATTTSTIASRFLGPTPYVRVDGTPISATGPAMFDGTDRLSFIHQDAAGQYLTSQYGAPVKTGAAPTVVGSNTTTCNDWTMTSPQPPTAGYAGSIAAVDLWDRTMGSCLAISPLLCLEL